jgi:hypothetical protein
MTVAHYGYVLRSRPIVLSVHAADLLGDAAIRDACLGGEQDAA